MIRPLLASNHQPWSRSRALCIDPRGCLRTKKLTRCGVVGAVKHCELDFRPICAIDHYEIDFKWGYAIGTLSAGQPIQETHVVCNICASVTTLAVACLFMGWWVSSNAEQSNITSLFAYYVCSFQATSRLYDWYPWEREINVLKDGFELNRAEIETTVERSHTSLPNS